jgi:DHA1 family bicyclomycin/chloramphenicol resistance-like MFS transporter
VVRDVADGPIAQRMLSQTTMMFALAPAIAPILGGWLYAMAGWRACFVFLAFVALTLAAFCWRFLPETLPPERRVSMRPGPMARAYAALATHGGFLRLAGALALNFAGFFLYVLAAPEFLVKVLGVSPQAFAWLFIPSIAGTMLGAFASSRLAGRLKPVDTIRIGYVVMFVAIALNLTQAFLMEPPRVPWATLPLLVYNFGLALAMAPLQVMALDQFDQRRGMAASGMAFAQSSGNALVAGLLAPLLWHSAGSMALGALVSLCAGALLFAWQVRHARLGSNTALHKP